MTATVFGLVIGAALVVVLYERLVRALRLELNQARANEQLLLTRLASRTPAEFHAVVQSQPEEAAPSVRWLRDATGLQAIAVPDDEVQ